MSTKPMARVRAYAFVAAKSQLTKANQTKTKMENLARELQKVGLMIMPCRLYTHVMS